MLSLAGMFRFVAFIFGVLGGFFLALLTLPLPGTTIFNKMSKLNPRLKNLIDDSIDLFVALFRVSSTGAKESLARLKVISKEAGIRFKQFKDKYRAELKKLKNSKTKIGQKLEEVEEIAV